MDALDVERSIAEGEQALQALLKFVGESAGTLEAHEVVGIDMDRRAGHRRRLLVLHRMAGDAGVQGSVEGDCLCAELLSIEH